MNRPATRAAFMAVGLISAAQGAAAQGAAAEGATARAAAAQAYAATAPVIRWDTYGVPHIYGPDVITVERGLGYAQMEAHAETILNNVALARGRSAEYFGAGAGNANITGDTAVHTYGIPQRAQLWLAQGGLEQSQLLSAFCAGANGYAQSHLSQIDPLLRQILPLVPSDITASEQLTIWFTFIPAQDNIFSGTPSAPLSASTPPSTLVQAWLQGGIAAANALAINHNPTGSNGWAIAPSHSATGNAILMGNPHLPWGNNQPAGGLGAYQWLEVNLVVGDPNAPSLNADGVTFAGGPFIGIGFNDHLGWTHTNNTIQAANLYQLSLDATGTHYIYGGASLPLSVRTDILKVKQADGSFTTQPITIKASLHGPVVATSTDGKTALALRVAGLDQPSLVTQYWHMIQATTLQQFVAADSMLQMPFFNVIYADDGGATHKPNILYKFGGRQPVRNGGTFNDYSGILDGTDPSKLWTSTFTWSQLPGAVNPAGGFVANSNNPPWTSAFPPPASLDPTKYPAYVAPQFMDFRPQHGAIFLQSKPKFTVDELIAGKMSTHMVLADRVLPDLLFAAHASADPAAAAAAGILAAWDRTGDADSVGGALFEEWWDLVVADIQAGKIPADTTDNFYSPHPVFTRPWNPKAPLTTPMGLANPRPLVAYLITAYNTLQTEFAKSGGAAVKWGDAHHTLLVNRDGQNQNLTGVAADHRQSGVDDPFGPLRVTNPSYVSFLNEYITFGGDGWVMLVDFTPQGSKAQVLLGYGNASRPNSPHIADQLPFFDTKTLRPALRTLNSVLAATRSTESY